MYLIKNKTPVYSIRKRSSLHNFSALTLVFLQAYNRKGKIVMKKIGIIFLVFCLTTLLITPTFSALYADTESTNGKPSVTFGDIDQNKAIDAKDALAALQHSVQSKLLTGNSLLAADVNADKTINALDALLILQYAVHKIDRFPADDFQTPNSEPESVISSEPDSKPESVVSSEPESKPQSNPESQIPSVPDSQPESKPDPKPDLPVSGLGGMTAYTLSGLPISKAVQQFSFAEIDGEPYIFTTQRVGATAYLSRCRIQDDKTAVCLDYAALEGFGHAESLNISVHNGKTYIFITSDANPNAGNYQWGTTVARLQYNQGTVSDVKTITGLEYATATGAMIAKDQPIYRANFALNDTADRIVFYFRSQKGTHALSTYRLSALQEKLDQADTISLKNCTDAFIATTGAKKLADICPNGSFQGIAVNPKGEILLSGGTPKVKPQLTCFTVNKQVIARKSITDIDWIHSQTLGTRDFASSTEFYEIESIQCYKDNYYVSFNPGNATLIQNHTEIYMLITL